MTNKITKKDYFVVIKAMVDAGGLTALDRESLDEKLRDVTAEEVTNFVDHEFEQLGKKSSSSKSKKNEENEAIKDLILATVSKSENENGMRVMEIRNEIGIDSPQKITSLITQMCKVDKTLERVEIKGNAYFKIPA